jgi:predicted transcriptional regulator of viral defense system
MPRTLSKQEARVVLTLEENHQTKVSRQEIVRILNAGLKAADHVIEALRKKGWLERVHWGQYELIPFDQGSSTIFCDKNHEMNGFMRR